VIERDVIDAVMSEVDGTNRTQPGSAASRGHSCIGDCVNTAQDPGLPSFLDDDVSTTADWCDHTPLSRLAFNEARSLLSLASRDGLADA
jgi:hypothetical protein